MRILHVIDSGGLHGAEIVLLNLMEAHREMELHPSLLSVGHRMAGQKAIEIEATSRGLEVNNLRFRDGLNYLGALEIIKKAGSLGSQLIHSHGYKGNILLCLLPRAIRNIPVLTTLHGWTSVRSFSRMGVYEIADAIAMKRLDRVVVVSQAMLNHTLIKTLRIHPHVINNGLPELEFPVDLFEKSYPQIAAACAGKFKLLCIGRLSVEKGFNIIISAIQRIVKCGIDACIVIAGEGEERERLVRLAETNNVSSRVHFAGYVDKAYRLMPSFDAFVLPSYTEGLPVTLLEAMQAEIPIIATAVGEVPELLDHGALGELVQPGDAEGMAYAIEKVYRNRDESKRKVIGARKKVLEKYGIKRMSEQYLDLYRKVISRVED